MGIINNLLLENYYVKTVFNAIKRPIRHVRKWGFTGLKINLSSHLDINTVAVLEWCVLMPV